MARLILDSDAKLRPLLDANGVPITGTGPEKDVGRFVGLLLVHTLDGSTWDVTLEGTVDGVNFEVVPNAANLAGDGTVNIPDFWRTFRVVSNTVDTLGTFAVTLDAVETN